MQSVKLKLIHAFGSTCSKMYRNVLAICDQDKNQPKIVFPSGKALARKYIDRQQMDFVQFSSNTQHIECMAILPTKTHVAVAQKCIESHLQFIKIYSMNSRHIEEPHIIKIFHESDKVGVIKQIVFSASEPKFMCALIGQPHNKLIFIDSSRNKPLAESNFAIKDIQKITICPHNSHLICISGRNFIKLFKIQEYAFKPLEDIKKFPKNRVITDHAWFKKKMVLVATDKSQILMLQEIKSNIYQVKQQYRNIFNEPQPENIIVTAICPFSKGFILGSNNGKFSLWTRKQDNSLQSDQKLQLTRKWSTTPERASEVISIAINMKEDMLVVSMANNDVATLYINEIMPQISQLIAQTQQKEVVFQYLYKGFHNHPITGMDICEQRPLIATCSTQDSTIRVWNYKNFGCKLLRMFYFKIKDQSQSNKPIITLSFHPSGYYMAVGCVDKLRIFHVLNNQLRPYRQIGIKKAHIVKFSNGGHFLSVSHPFLQDNQNDYIRVYNALTLEELFSYKDTHSIVKTIQWKHSDDFMITTCKNGTLVQWKVSDWTIQKKIVKKQLTFEASVYNQTNKSILVYGQSNNKYYLEEFGQTDRNMQIDMKVSKMLDIPFGKSNNCILLALQNGPLVLFGGINRPIVYDNLNHHIGKATQLILSPCGRYVITSGTDCLILIYQLNVLNQQTIIKKNELACFSVVDDFLADVVLINKKQIQKYNSKQKQYTKVISVLSKKLKILSEDGIKKQKLLVSQLEIQKNRIIEDISYRISRIKQQIIQLKQKNDSQLQNLDSINISQAQQLQNNYQQKINFQEQKYFQLQQQLIQLKLLHKKKVQRIHKQEQETIKVLKTQFEQKFKQSQGVFSQTKKQTSQANEIFQKRLKQIQDQQQEQLRQIESKKQKFKLQTAAILQDLHQRLQKLKKQHSGLQKQKSQLKSQKQQLSFNKRKIQKDVNQAKQKYKDLLADYDQKIQSLKRKQQKIIQFQCKINQLQKKKHILSYKATQMRKAIEPKQYQIQKLKLDLIKLKKQFQISLERKEKANLFLQKIIKQKQYTNKCLQDQKKITQQQVNFIDQIMGDIFVCLENANQTKIKGQSLDHKVYFKQIIKLYHRYVDKQFDLNKPNTIQNSGSEQSKGADEVTKQIVHLQKSLFQLNKSNQKNILRKNEQIFKRTKQNTELVNNLNQIKKQNKQLMLKIKSKNIEITNLKNTKSQLIANCGQIDNVTLKLMMTNTDDVIQNLQIPKRPFSKTRLTTLVKGKNNNEITEQSKVNLNPSQNAKVLSSLQNKKDFSSLGTYQKKQCQIMSEIQFTNQRCHKLDFYLKDMRDRVKKHIVYSGCEEANSILPQQQSYNR